MTLTVQVPPPTSEPPENEIEALPAVGLNVGVPQLFMVALGVAATFIAPGEIGKVSVKATPAKGVDAFGLVIVKVSVEVPPARIGLWAKALVILAGVSTTRVAVLLTAPGPAIVCVVVAPPLLLA